MSTHTEALRFWSEMSNRDYLPLLFINQYQTLSQQYDDLSSFDLLNSEMETYLQDKLGYIAMLGDKGELCRGPRYPAGVLERDLLFVRPES